MFFGSYLHLGRVRTASIAHSRIIYSSLLYTLSCIVLSPSLSQLETLLLRNNSLSLLGMKRRGSVRCSCVPLRTFPPTPPPTLFLLDGNSRHSASPAIRDRRPTAAITSSAAVAVMPLSNMLSFAPLAVSLTFGAFASSTISELIQSFLVISTIMCDTWIFSCLTFNFRFIIISFYDFLLSSYS